MSTTYFVRRHSTSETSEHATDGDATAHAGVMAVLHGGVWLVIRKTGRLSTVVRRRCADVPYPKNTPAERQVRSVNDQCEHRFPLPSWMGPNQDDPCRCDLGVGHAAPHSCEHLRGTGQARANPEVPTEAGA